MKNFFSIALIMLCFNLSAVGQILPVQNIRADSVERKNVFPKIIPMTGIGIPGAAMAYGFVKLGSHPLTDLDRFTRQEAYGEHPHMKVRIDDYLQFAPGGMVFLLGAAGKRGRHGMGDQAGIYLLSNVILNSICQGLKNVTKVTRPDGTSNSFPSGHTAEAFASAEFLRLEYGSYDNIFLVTGYGSATATGYLRIYNNKHWLSDVVAGAGLGILSTRAAYWLYPKIKALLKNGAGSNMLMLPRFSQGNPGVVFYLRL